MYKRLYNFKTHVSFFNNFYFFPSHLYIDVTFGGTKTRDLKKILKKKLKFKKKLRPAAINDYEIAGECNAVHKV